MNTFLQQITAVKRLARIRRVTRTVLVAVMIFLGIHAVVSGLDRLGVSAFTGESHSYGLYALLSLILAVFSSLIRGESFMDVLIEMEGRLKLKERISTAYEYYLLKRRSAFDELLFSDAAESLRSVDKRKVFPLRFSFIHLSIVSLMVINILILLVGSLPAVPGQDRLDPGTLKEVNELIGRYSREKQDIPKREKRKKHDEIHRKFEDIAKKLQEGDVLRQRMDSSIQETLQEIETEKTTLSQGLTSKIERGDMEPVPVIKKREIQRLALYNLEKLEEMLRGTFDNRIPDSIGDDLALLKEYSELERLLESILSRMNMALKDMDHPEISRRDQDESSSGDRNGRDPEQGSGRDHKEERGGEGPSKEGDQETGSEGSGFGQADEGEGAENDDGEVSKEGESSTAGKAKSDGREATPREIEKTAGPALQDKTVPSSGEGHILRIRSLTAPGEARMKEEDIVKKYRREIESVIQKEDIPLNYREYIKNYFLSIHLRKEEDAQ